MNIRTQNESRGTAGAKYRKGSPEKTCDYVHKMQKRHDPGTKSWNKTCMKRIQGPLQYACGTPASRIVIGHLAWLLKAKCKHGQHRFKSRKENNQSIISSDVKHARQSTCQGNIMAKRKKKRKEKTENAKFMKMKV